MIGTLKELLCGQVEALPPTEIGYHNNQIILMESIVVNFRIVQQDNGMIYLVDGYFPSFVRGARVRHSCSLSNVR